MADTVVDNYTATTPDGQQTPSKQGWTSPSIGAKCAVDDSQDLLVLRTTDSGATWTPTQVQAGSAQGLSVVFDKDVPNDTGDNLNICWADEVSGDFLFVTFDVAANSLGTIRTISSTLTIDPVTSRTRTAIAKTRSGNLIIGIETQTEVATYRSTDLFASNNDKLTSDLFETASQEDYAEGFAANTGDDDDAAFLYVDRSASEVSVKVFDNSNTGSEFGETGIALNSGEENARWSGITGAIYHTDGKLREAHWTEFDATTADLVSNEITIDTVGAGNATVTAKGDIALNQAESVMCCMQINQQNSDVRVAFAKGTSVFSLLLVRFYLSTDDMSSWGSELAYGEDTEDDIRFLSCAQSVGDPGGRWMPGWYNDDLQDLFVNETNAVEIAAAVGGDIRSHIIPAYMRINA